MKAPALMLLIISYFSLACQPTNEPTHTDNKLVPTTELLEQQQIHQQQFELFIRAFKKEKQLEVWAKNKTDLTFKLLVTYPFCTTSGELGPKRQEGDFQIPEGCYWIDRFNPNSNFHLSLGLNYPNDADRKLGHPVTPGSNIFIHGDCVSVGCIPITDSKIEVLYELASRAKTNGQNRIQVHIFPSQELEVLIKEGNQHQAFWKELLPIFNYFETKKQLPKFWIRQNGSYALAQQ